MTDQIRYYAVLYSTGKVKRSGYCAINCDIVTAIGYLPLGEPFITGTGYTKKAAKEAAQRSEPEIIPTKNN